MSRLRFEPVHGGNLVWAARLAQCAPPDLLDFSASISPLGPPPSILAAIQAAFSSLAAYPDPGYQILRQQLAQAHRIAADCVLPGNGAAELLTWAGRELAQRPCWLLAPAFSDYARAIAAFSGKTVEVPLQQQTWPTDPQWAAALTAAIPMGTDLSQCGLLLNNPHNPTGALLNQETIRPFLDAFGLVVVDEAFMDFLPPSQQQSVIAWVERFPNLVVLRSLTKFYSLPGLRIGYAVAHPDRLQSWQRWRDPWSVNTLAEAAAIAAIQDKAFQQQTWDWLAVAKPDLYTGLAALPGLTPRPGSANFLLVGCDCPSSELQKQLLIRHKIYIRDCSSFAQMGDRHFRVAVKTAADHQRLFKALADVLPICDRG